MKLPKKSLLVLASSMLLVTAACGGKSEGTGGSASPASSADAAKPDTVKLWTYPVHGKYEDELKPLLEEFKTAHPNIKVEYEMLSWAEGPKKFDVALNAGDPPDLYFGGASGNYVNTGLAVNLDPYMTQEIKDDYVAGALDGGKIGGKQYSLPLYQFQWAWGGNKRILEEAGIDWKKVQANGWTWTEFNEAAKKLTKKLPDGSQQYGLVTDGQSLDFMELVTRNNNLPEVVDKDGKFIWNDARILDSLKFIENLIKTGVMPKESAALTAQKRTDMFYDGKAAIISKAIPYYDVMFQNRVKDIDAGKIKGEKIDFVLLPVPHKDDAKAVTYMGAQGYVMFNQKNDKGEQHRKNAFMLMEFLSGAKAGNSSNELCLPFVRKSQAKAFEGKGLANPINKTASETMAKFASQPIDLMINTDKATQLKQFKDQVEKPNFQALLAGEKTAEQVAEDFKTKGAQILR